jgi:hypothetical protein
VEVSKEMVKTYSNRYSLFQTRSEAVQAILYTMRAKMAKTYNSGYSLVVTHLTTNPLVRCLNRAERTGSLVFNVLWSYVQDLHTCRVHIFSNAFAEPRSWPVNAI